MMKIITVLIFISFVLLPLDSFPFILPSIYRPISIIFLVLCFPLISYYTLIKTKTYNKNFILLVAFYIISVSYSFIRGYFFYKDLSGFFDFTVALTIGIMVFITYDFYFTYVRNKSSDNEEYITQIFRLLGNIYLFVLFIGFIEIFVMFGFIPLHLKEIFAAYTTGRTSIRIQLLSGEPSWAAQQLLFIMPVYFHLMKSKKIYLYALLLSIVLFFLMYSIQGYIILAAGLTILLILQKDFKLIAKYVSIMVGALVLVFIISQLLAIFFLADFPLADRILDIMDIRSFSGLITLDGSFFIRLVFPLIGILMFFNRPILGIGGGHYKFELKYYIDTYFPEGYQFENVNNLVLSTSGNAKSMYSRLLAENGIVGFSIFMYFIWTILKKVFSVAIKGKLYIQIWIIFILLIYLQFDSFAYVHAWLVFAFINNLTTTPILND